MPPMERRRIVVDTAKSDWEPGDVEGHARFGLYFASPRGERVTMERLGAGVTLPETDSRRSQPRCNARSGSPADRGHCSHPNLVWAASPLCPDMIFGKDNSLFQAQARLHT